MNPYTVCYSAFVLWEQNLKFSLGDFCALPPVQWFRSVHTLFSHCTTQSQFTVLRPCFYHSPNKWSRWAYLSQLHFHNNKKNWLYLLINEASLNIKVELRSHLYLSIQFWCDFEVLNLVQPSWHQPLSHYYCDLNANFRSAHRSWKLKKDNIINSVSTYRRKQIICGQNAGTAGNIEAKLKSGLHWMRLYTYTHTDKAES